MTIEKVSAYFLYEGNYMLYIYKGDEINTNELVYQQSFIAMPENWQDITLPIPVTIDCSQDLWVVLYSSIDKPATVCVYTSPDKENAALLSNTGVRWTPLTNRSCLMKTCLTDGTYTYNLYRDGTIVANNLNVSNYTDANLPDGFYDYHVTTNYFGGESDPSNIVHVQVVNPTYTVTATANPSNGGTVTGGGTFNYGQSCTVTATPNMGYTFINWTENGNVVSTHASYSFSVTGNRNLVAHFRLDSYVISVSANPSNGGTVTGGGAFHNGDNCTVFASASAGYRFVNWTENGSPVSVDSTYFFTVISDRTLVANFTTQAYVVTAIADPIGGGMITGAGGYNYGETCTLTATANAGYNFQRWTKNGAQVSQNSCFSFTVTESATYVAHFEVQTYTITVVASPAEGGAASGGGTFAYGQSCTLHASANACYAFDRWMENGNVASSQANYSFTVTGDRNLVANFTRESYEITAETNPEGAGIVTGVGSYQCGETCTLNAIPNENYIFLNWTENGNVIPNGSIMQFTVTGQRHFVANFIYHDGVEESAMPIEVYPNPVNDILTIKGEGIRRVTVYNVMGQVVEDRELEGQEEIRIDVNGYGSASYILCIYTENGLVVERFIKD